MSLKVIFNPFESQFQFVDSNSAIVYATGITGTDFTISQSGSTVTYSIPLASASATGKLDAADWVRFNAAATGDVTGVANSSSINLTKTGQNVSGVVNLSASAASANNQLVTLAIKSDGLMAQIPNASILGLVSAVAPLVDTSGAFSIPKGSTTQDGYIASGDFTTFNNKQASGNYIVALTGDVAASGPGTVAGTIQSHAVSNSKLAQMATLTIKGNNTTGTADPLDLTVSQVNTMLGDVTTIGTFDNQTSNASGAAITGNTLFMQSASTGFPGLVNISTQSFAGNKTFTGSISASNFSGTSSGTNTGDVTLATAGSSPNASGASLAGQVLTLQPANASNAGIVSTAAQSFAGAKTFTTSIAVSGSTSGAVTMQAASAVTSYTLTLPASQGASGQYPANDGSGNLSWVSPNLVPGDLNAASASIANNQSSAANVSGLSFANATVRSARVEYSIAITATTSLYETGVIQLVQRGSDWAIGVNSWGDDSLVTFDVTAAGVVQYTTPSYTGFTSAKMQYRAFVTAV